MLNLPTTICELRSFANTAGLSLPPPNVVLRLSLSETSNRFIVGRVPAGTTVPLGHAASRFPRGIDRTIHDVEYRPFVDANRVPVFDDVPVSFLFQGIPCQEITRAWCPLRRNVEVTRKPADRSSGTRRSESFHARPARASSATRTISTTTPSSSAASYRDSAARTVPTGPGTCRTCVHTCAEGIPGTVCTLSTSASWKCNPTAVGRERKISEQLVAPRPSLDLRTNREISVTRALRSNGRIVPNLSLQMYPYRFVKLEILRSYRA